METEGPGLSARIMCMFCPPESGRNAIMKTNTPMPPIQCVKLRQNSEACERLSTSVRIEAPVVVKPEADSNSASIKTGISRVNQSGSAPKRLSTIHESATITNPSREKSARFLALPMRKSPPTITQAPAAAR